MSSLLVFIFGLAIGSFLNVLIYRLPKKESILGYSKCPARLPDGQECRKKIPWHENIPVLSFFFLRGRCSNCGSKISRQYPAVELLTAFLFLISFWIYGQSTVFLVYVLFLIGLFIVIGFIDFKHFIIPDSLILAGFIVSLFYFLFFFSSLRSTFYVLHSGLVDSLLGIIFFAGIFLALFLISKGKWLGFGDVKLAALLGFIFGFRGAVDILYLTFLIGAVWVIILLGFRKAGLKTEVPLGSMMVLAAIVFLAFKVSILDLIWLNY